MERHGHSSKGRTLRPLYLSSSSLEAKDTASQKNIMDRFDVHRCSGRKKHGIYCTECGQIAKDLQFFALDSTAIHDIVIVL